MKLIDELKKINDIQINNDLINQIEEKYECKLSDEVKKIISVSDDFCSYEDSIIRMDNVLILEPEEDLFCDFKAMSLIPIFDCYDNNYLCYDYSNNQWCLFNLMDESPYNTNVDILKLISFDED